MFEKFILAIDQGTSGTKALIFDEKGALVSRFDKPHRQIINEKGWVEHDPLEIYRNTIQVVKTVLEQSGVDKAAVAGAGISNQRETAVVWDRRTGLPVCNAVVWQCSRSEPICSRIMQTGGAEIIKKNTGLRLSPYFSASKFAWILENVPGLHNKSLCCGTVDSWLIYKLTGVFKTDFSNASRTQLFDLHDLCWSGEICALFGIDPAFLAQVCDSDGFFGESDFDGCFDRPIPIRGVLGDSHGALLGQGCLTPGAIKATYGTGSSVMMNVGENPVFSDGAVTSLAWKLNGKVNYALEGNINYTGAVIKWLVDDLGLMSSAKEAGKLAANAGNIDGMYLVPAFSGLGAPYWDEGARAMLCGMGRGCGKAELVRAAEECIAYQVTDILRLMDAQSGIAVKALRVDGGPVNDAFLMQFQADIADVEVVVPAIEELSGMGAACAAGTALGVYNRDTAFERPVRAKYVPFMNGDEREKKYSGWRSAVQKTLSEQKK